MKKNIEIRFEGGPMGGSRRMVDEVTPYIRVAIHSPETNGMTQVGVWFALYELWDNWPVRYKFIAME